MTIRNWSTTPADNNSTPPNGAPEGWHPSAVNNTVRQNMAELRDTFEQLPYFDYGHTPTRVDNDTFTVATDLTATYYANRRVKLVGATTGYATIASSSYSAPDTTVNVTMDSGNVPTSLTYVSLGFDTDNAPTLSTSIEYPQTAAELAALVTPVNFYISGDDVDIRRQGVTPASTATQITTAINQILSEGKNCYLPSVNGALTTWAFNGTLLFTASGQKLYGPCAEQVLLNYTGAGNTTLIGNSGTTLRLRNRIEGLRIDAINKDGITAIDWSHMTGGYIQAVVNLNGNNCIVAYLKGNTAGDRPYWNDLRDLEGFSNNITGSTSGSIGILFDRVLNGSVTNGGWNGPNANHIDGGRMSGFDKKVVMRAGNGNVFSNHGGESNLTNHYEFGVTTADVTGTFTAGAINTATDGGASWATNNFAGGSVQITGGTGSGQYREVQSNTATAITVNPYWDTVPDATSTYALNLLAGQGNAIINCYAEGDVSHNPNFLQIFPSVQSTTLIGGQIGSLGTGAVVTQSLRRPTDRLNPLGWKDPYPVIFGVTALAAAQTNLAIKPVGITRSQVTPLGTWGVLGVDIEMTGVIAAGTCTIQLLDNGSVMSGTAMVLSATNTFNAGGGSVRQWHFPPQMFQSTGSYHTLGVQVTTSAGWTAGNDLYVTVHVQQR